MNTFVLGQSEALRQLPSRTAARRTALVAGAGAAAAAAWWLASGAPPAADPALAVLLRAMAAIKGLMAAGAAAIVWWRLGMPASPKVAATYIGCIWTLVACTVLIWQSAYLPAAAVLFHAGGLAGLVLALRDGRNLPGVASFMTRRKP